MSVVNSIKKITSYLYPIKVENTSSRYNPVLEVTIENGRYVLNAAHANYSFGSLHRIFLKTFDKVKVEDRAIKNVLLLGLGAGSVPEILFEKYKLNCKITAIEIDEKVVELAKKYFNINRFTNLEIITADASEYTKNTATTFDLIVVDLFIDHKVPAQFEHADFINSLHSVLNAKGMMLFNKIKGEEDGLDSILHLKNNFESVFSNVEVVPVFGNYIFKIEEKNSSGSMPASPLP